MKNRVLAFLLVTCIIFAVFSSCADNELTESSQHVSSMTESGVEDKEELYREISRMQQEIRSEVSRAEEAARGFQETSGIQRESEEEQGSEKG